MSPSLSPPLSLIGRVTFFVFNTALVGERDFRKTASIIGEVSYEYLSSPNS